MADTEELSLFIGSLYTQKSHIISPIQHKLLPDPSAKEKQFFHFWVLFFWLAPLKIGGFPSFVQNTHCYHAKMQR